MKEIKNANYSYIVYIGRPDGSTNEVQLEASNWQTAARLCVSSYTGDSAEPYRVTEYLPKGDNAGMRVASWEVDSDFVAKLNTEIIAAEDGI